MFDEDEMLALTIECRLYLRLSTQALDTEIRQTIEACLLDLRTAGVLNASSTDPLVRQAVKLYCKAGVGYEPDAERYQRAYEALKRSLALSGDYNTVD